jgi:hypothetical protein
MAALRLAGDPLLLCVFRQDGRFILAPVAERQLSFGHEMAVRGQNPRQEVQQPENEKSALCRRFVDGETRTRTGDTTIFRHLERAGGTWRFAARMWHRGEPPGRLGYVQIRADTGGSGGVLATRPALVAKTLARTGHTRWTAHPSSPGESQSVSLQKKFCARVASAHADQNPPDRRRACPGDTPESVGVRSAERHRHGRKVGQQPAQANKQPVDTRRREPVAVEVDSPEREAADLVRVVAHNEAARPSRLAEPLADKSRLL